MLQIIGLVLVIAAVFAIKTVAIVRTHDRLIAQDASFSWMHVRPEDEAVAAAWSVEEEARHSDARVAVGALRPIGGASA